MITVQELNKYLENHTAISSMKAVLKLPPYCEGTVFKIKGLGSDLFISNKVNGIYFHSALSLLYGNHPFMYRCFYVYPSEVKPLVVGILV